MWILEPAMSSENIGRESSLSVAFAILALLTAVTEPARMSFDFVEMLHFTLFCAPVARVCSVTGVSI